MTFWDASALVPLCVREQQTPIVRGLLQPDQPMIVWFLSKTEIFSALCRKVREGALSEADLETARAARDRWFEASVVVRDMPAVAKRADRILRVHRLRAADALQLAAAVLVCEPDVEAHRFITFAQRLARAARREGFAAPLSQDSRH